MDGSLRELTTWIAPGAFALGGLAVGFLVRATLVPVVARAAARSAWRYDDALIEAIRNPVVVWFVLIGLRIALRVLPLPADTENLLGSGVLVLAILSVTWALARFAGLAIRARAAESAQRGVSLIANVVRSLVYVIGVLVLLQTLGISVTPLITALGVGGLAVGLALQDTLANFFAGIRILAAGKIRPGDFVKLDSGEEGFVEDISWAQTSIRQLPNSLVMVPNARLVGAILTNYDLPDREQAVLVQVGVHYDSDLAKVEQVTVAVAREALAAVPGAVASFEPFIRYHTFGDSSINFTVIMRARHHTERFLLTHEFVKKLHARYAAEGIEIPFPIRTVYMKNAGA